MNKIVSNLNLGEVGAISLDVNTSHFQVLNKLSKGKVQCFIDGVSVSILQNDFNPYDVVLQERIDEAGVIQLYFSITKDRIEGKKRDDAMAEVEAFNRRVNAYIEETKVNENTSLSEDIDSIFASEPPLVVTVETAAGAKTKVDNADCGDLSAEEAYELEKEGIIT